LTDLTSLTLAEARDRLKSRAVSSVELDAGASERDRAVEGAQRVCRDHRRSCDGASASERRRFGQRRRWAARRAADRRQDLYATRGVHTQACSHILDGFKPPYESTVTANLWRDGAVMLGKLNMDEFAMGSSNETSYYGPVASPWLPPNWSVERARSALGSDKRGLLTPGGFVGRLGLGGRRAAVPCGDRERHRRLDPSTRRVHRHRRDQADLWTLLALRHGAFASSLDQAGPIARTVRDGRDHAALDGGTGPQGFDLRRSARSRLRSSDRPLAERPDDRHPQGIQARRHVFGDRDALDARRAMAAGGGRAHRRVSLPHTRHALPAYYIVAPAEALAISRATTACANGLREPGEDIAELYENTACEGLRRGGASAPDDRDLRLVGRLLRRILCSCAKDPNVIKRDFETVFRRWRGRDPDARYATAAFGIGEKGSADPVEMYLNDVFTVTVNMAGLPGLAAPARTFGGRIARWLCS